MCLVIYSNLPIEQIEDQIEEKFKNIDNKQLNQLEYKENAPAFLKSHKSKLIRLGSVKKEKHLIFYFILPSYKQKYRNNPLRVLSFIFGNEGKGSLLSLLIRKKLAFELFSGKYNYLDMFTSFEFTIKLTDKGFERYEEVVCIVFDFIRKLNDQPIPKYLIENLSKIDNFKFEFRNMKTALNKSIELAGNTMFYPPEIMNKLYFLFESCTQEEIGESLSYLRPENLLLFLRSKEFDDIENKEPIFDCPYRAENLPGALLNRLIQILDSKGGEMIVTRRLFDK